MEAMKTMILASGKGKRLSSAPGEVQNANAQGEYYLTDVPGIPLHRGLPVGTYFVRDDAEMPGVNMPEELAACEAILHAREEPNR